MNNMGKKSSALVITQKIQNTEGFFSVYNLSKNLSFQYYLSAESSEQIKTLSSPAQACSLLVIIFCWLPSGSVTVLNYPVSCARGALN